MKNLIYQFNKNKFNNKFHNKYNDNVINYNIDFFCQLEK